MVSTRIYCLGCPFMWQNVDCWRKTPKITSFARLLLGAQQETRVCSPWLDSLCSKINVCAQVLCELHPLHDWHEISILAGPLVVTSLVRKAMSNTLPGWAPARINCWFWKYVETILNGLCLVGWFSDPVIQASPVFRELIHVIRDRVVCKCQETRVCSPCWAPSCNLANLVIFGVFLKKLHFVT